VTALRFTALRTLARAWIAFSAFGMFGAVAGMLQRTGGPLIWHGWTIVLSGALIAGGLGVLRGRPWGRWVAIAAVTAALTEVMLFMTSGTPDVLNPVLIGTALFHAYGLVLLAVASRSAPGQGLSASAMETARSRDRDGAGPSRRSRHARAVTVLLLVIAVAYVGFLGVEVSHQLVNRHTRDTDCRTPAQLGVSYQAINYDIAADTGLAEREPDMTNCSAPGARPGEELVTSDGVRLAGWYVPAASEIGPVGPTIVVSHGWTSNKSAVLETLDIFHERYNMVLFDFRNHGQSAQSLTTQGIHEQRDLAAVMEWLSTTKGPETIVLWGQSMGGHTAINVAADDPRVDAVILDSTHSALTVPMTNRIESKGHPFGAVGSFAGVVGSWIRTGVNVLGDDPVAAIAELGSRPVLLIHASDDDTIPLLDAERMLDAALRAGVRARLEVCPEAGHAGLIEACPDEYRRWVDEFLADVPSS